MISRREQEFDYRNPDKIISAYRSLTESSHKVTSRMYRVVADPPNVAVLKALNREHPLSADTLFARSKELIERLGIEIDIQPETFDGRLRVLSGMEILEEKEGNYDFAPKGRELLDCLLEGRMPSAHSG